MAFRLDEIAEREIATETTGIQFQEFKSFLESKWIEHRDARVASGIDAALSALSKAYSNQYTADKLSKIQAMGYSETYFPLSKGKANDALSYLKDVFEGNEARTWRLNPTPMPGVPDQLVQDVIARVSAELQAPEIAQKLHQEPPEALQRVLMDKVKEVSATVLREATRTAERRVADVLEEGGLYDCFPDLFYNFVVLRAGILKGPVLIEQDVKKWVGTRLQVVKELRPTFRVVSPMDAYPAPSAVDFSGDFIERERVGVMELIRMREQSHFDKDALKRIIDDFETHAGSRQESVDSEKADSMVEEKPVTDAVKGTVEILNFWLDMPGSWLIKSGKTEIWSGGREIKVDEDRPYHVEAIMVSGEMVYVGENPDILGRKPYFKTGWSVGTGSFWHQSLVDDLTHCQEVANACMRSVVNNMGIASGPQIVISDERRLVKPNVTAIYPFRVWRCSNPTNSLAEPIKFHQPVSIVTELLGALDKTVEYADRFSGVPRFLMGGEPPPGVGRTSGGLGMLLSAAAKGLRRVILQLDRDIVRPAIEQVYDFLLDNDDEDVIHCDVEVVVNGTVEVLARMEAADKRLAVLKESNNPLDMKLFGTEGRASLWRGVTESIDSFHEPIMRSEEVVRREAEEERSAMMAEQNAKTQAARMDAQLKQAEMQLKQAELQLAARKYESESQLAALKTQLEIENARARAAVTERMSANVAHSTAKEVLDDRHSEAGAGGAGGVAEPPGGVAGPEDVVPAEPEVPGGVPFNDGGQ